MGLIGQVLTLVFGGGRNAVRETAEVFRENAEAAGQRESDRFAAVIRQHEAEFRARRGWFDQVMDGINRLPRPMLALGTLGLFVAAMVDPIWFAERMQGLALVPEALWWLMGAVVSFYFGARHQVKGQQFQKDIAQTMARVPQVVENTKVLRSLEDEAQQAAARDPNPALSDWRASRAA